jgi:tRNA threonylcarbamoyladenosine biosynthesis protein TsaB
VKILTLDTSTSLASVAVTVSGAVASESVFSTDRTLSARLIPEIERLLIIAGFSITGIDLFACTTGPGSFTGVRAGIATTQGLALATGKPCVGFSSLALLALNFPLAAYPVCTLLDARKGEVYGALFDCSSPLPVTLINDCVMPPERFLDDLCSKTGSPVIFAGEGAVRYRDVITERMGTQARIALFPHNVGHSTHGALLALEQYRTGQALEPVQLLPVYLRASEAEYAKMDQQKTRMLNRNQ